MSKPELWSRYTLFSELSRILFTASDRDWLIWHLRAKLAYKHWARAKG